MPPHDVSFPRQLGVLPLACVAHLHVAAVARLLVFACIAFELIRLLVGVEVAPRQRLSFVPVPLPPFDVVPLHKLCDELLLPPLCDELLAQPPLLFVAPL